MKICRRNTQINIIFACRVKYAMNYSLFIILARNEETKNK